VLLHHPTGASNQKFADLTARHGAANVGLLTATRRSTVTPPIVVMTTEVLRNMLTPDRPPWTASLRP